MWRSVASVSDIGSVHCRDTSNAENLPGLLFDKKVLNEAKHLTVVSPKDNNNLWIPVPFQTKLKGKCWVKMLSLVN